MSAKNDPQATANTLVIAQFFCFAMLGGSLILQPVQQTTAGIIAGVVLGVIGVGVALAAIVEHQRANRALPRVYPQPNQRVGLIQSGLYSRIRHPIYTGVLLTVIGASLAHGQGFDWAVTVVLFAVLSIKSRFEEGLLIQAYPTYADYMTRTGRFTPWF